MLTVTCIEWETKLDDAKSIGWIAHKEGKDELAEYIEGYPRYEQTFATPLEDVELMQFTGLLDKNGKEIYEGDILKFYFGSKWERDQVQYDDKYAHYSLKESNITLNFFIENEDTLEVIGNIYENPELIN